MLNIFLQDSGSREKTSSVRYWTFLENAQIFLTNFEKFTSNFGSSCQKVFPVF
jgi:hypothetical protein